MPIDSTASLPPDSTSHRLNPTDLTPTRGRRELGGDAHALVGHAVGQREAKAPVRHGQVAVGHLHRELGHLAAGHRLAEARLDVEHGALGRGEEGRGGEEEEAEHG